MRKATKMPAAENVPLHQPETKVATTSETDRAARLLELRQQVREGTYRIPADAIAAKLMERIRIDRN